MTGDTDIGLVQMLLESTRQGILDAGMTSTSASGIEMNSSKTTGFFVLHEKGLGSFDIQISEHVDEDD